MLITADSAYIREVHRGLSLYRKGLLVYTIASGLFGFFLIASMLLFSKMIPYQGMFALRTVALVAKLFMLRGLWRYTTLENEQANLERPGSARSVARISLVIASATSIIIMLLDLVARSVGPAIPGGKAMTAMQVAPLWTPLLFILNAIASVVMFFAVLRYTAWMFGRVPSVRDQMLCDRYMWLLPLIFIFGMCFVYIGPIVAGILLWHILGRLQSYLKDLEGAIALNKPS